MKKRTIAFLTVAIWFTLGTAWAGNVRDEQYHFEFEWPDSLKRNTDKEGPANILNLSNRQETVSFAITVAKDVHQGEDYLRSEACRNAVLQPYGSTTVHHDSMVKFGRFPARRVVFQLNKHLVAGTVQTIARGTMYIFVAVRQDVTPEVCRKWLDQLLAKFRFHFPKDKKPAPESPDNNASSEKPEPGKKPAPQKAFGSDF